MDTKWLEWCDTLILLRKLSAYACPEWWPIAQITLRQVYNSAIKQWYAWDNYTSMSGDGIDIGHFDTKELAIKAVEEYFTNLDKKELDSINT